MPPSKEIQTFILHFWAKASLLGLYITFWAPGNKLRRRLRIERGREMCKRIEYKTVGSGADYGKLEYRPCL